MIPKIKAFVVIFSLAIFFPQIIFAQEVLTLDQCIEIALKNSSVIRIAQEGHKSATAQKKEALTAFLPKLSTSYSYTRLNEDPSFDFPGAPPFIPPGEIVTGTVNNYNWAVEAKQPLFAGGGLLANYEASKIGEDVAALEEQAKIQDVVHDVTIAYYNVLKAQHLQEVARQSVDMLKAHRDVAEHYFKVGMIPKNDLLYAEVEWANGKQALVRAQNASIMARTQLNSLLKRDVFAPGVIADAMTYQPFGSSLEACMEAAKQSRPELRISFLKTAQAAKMVNVAKSEYFPALHVVGNYTRFGDEPSVSGSAYKDMESWYLMAVASWNFWEWGKTKFRVDSGKAKENQALEASRALYDQMVLEIKNAYLLLREAESQIAVSQKLIEQAEENFRIATERYKESIATSTEVLDAQTLLTRAKSDYISALGDYHIHLTRLQRAMGTLWP
jgi:outer membrane protein TolC